MLGSLAASDLLLRNDAALGVDPKTFYAAALGDIFIFASLVFFAFRERFNPASHIRLILIATIACWVWLSTGGLSKLLTESLS